jgi:hypothetical protein
MQATLHTLSRTAHQHSPPVASVPEQAERVVTCGGEPPQTAVNETKTEPTSRPRLGGWVFQAEDLGDHYLGDAAGVWRQGLVLLAGRDADLAGDGLVGWLGGVRVLVADDGPGELGDRHD